MEQKRLLEYCLRFFNKKSISNEIFPILFQQKMLYFFLEYPEFWESDFLLEKARGLFFTQKSHIKKVLRTSMLLSETFQNHGIQHCFVKGVAFSNNYIPRPNERPTSDVDILIKEEDLPRILRILFSKNFFIPTINTGSFSPEEIAAYIDSLHINHNRQRTYYLQHGEVLVCRETGISVELHVTLLDTQEHTSLNFHRMAVEQMLSNATYSRSGYRVLSAEDSLLFFSWHAIKHLLGGQNTVCDSNRSNFINLRGLTDIAFILLNGGIDLDTLISRAELYGFVSSLRLAIKYCEELCGKIHQNLLSMIPMVVTPEPYDALLMQYEKKISLSNLYYTEDRFLLMRKIVSEMTPRKKTTICALKSNHKAQKREEICDDQGQKYYFSLFYDKEFLYIDFEIPNNRLYTTKDGDLRVVPVIALGIYECGECQNACALNLEFHINKTAQKWNLKKISDPRKTLSYPIDNVYMTVINRESSVCFNFALASLDLGLNVKRKEGYVPFDFGISVQSISANGREYECFNSWTGNNRIRFRKCYFLGMLNYQKNQL